MPRRDTIRGDAGDDYSAGGEGNERFLGNNGGDWILGGPRIDAWQDSDNSLYQIPRDWVADNTLKNILFGSPDRPGAGVLPVQAKALGTTAADTAVHVGINIIEDGTAVTYPAGANAIAAAFALEGASLVPSDNSLMPERVHQSPNLIFSPEHGFTGGYTVVKDAVREMTVGRKEVFLPLDHPPGEAQVDYGFATVNLAGVATDVAVCVMTLPHSGAVYLQVFPRECTETFLEGHVRAFGFFGGVPRRIAYDNANFFHPSTIAGASASTSSLRSMAP